MISERELGRYEHTNDGHNKFYTVQYNAADDNYTIIYGPINGAPTQIKKSEGITESTARRKISEKLGKGYRHIGGPTKIESNNNSGPKVSKSKGHNTKVGNRKLDI